MRNQSATNEFTLSDMLWQISKIVYDGPNHTEVSMSRALLLLSLAAPLFAQLSSGTLTGLVSDPQDARVPGVALKLTNEDTGLVNAGSSNEQGEYTFSLLPSGRYKITAEKPGFSTLNRTGLTIELGRVVRLDLTITVGQVSESVQVTGAAPLLDSESATMGQFIENKTIVDMPLNGRRVGELLGMIGASVFITGDVIRPRVSIAGGRADQQQWLLDGVNASNIALEVPQALFNPPVEAVQEIKVHQSVYAAELGNTSGGAVTMTTRSGTNKFHGVAYEYFRNEKLDARNFFAASRAPLRWNIFGGSLGGPIIKNKTFFFSHVEFQRQRIGVTRNLTIPTAAERLGDFSATTNAAGARTGIFDSATGRPNPANPAQVLRDAFPNNIIPPNRIDPVGLKMAELFPLPNRAPSNLAGANNFIANTANALNITTWTSKVDHVLSDRDRISVRYVLHNFPTYNGTVFPIAAADPNGGKSDRRAHSLLFNHLHNFTPALVNDFRFNWQPRFFINRSYGLDEGWPAKLGLRGVSDRAMPRINISGYASIGVATHERVQTPIRDSHLVNSLSWFHGKHAFKFGGEGRFGRNAEVFNPLISGQFGFNVQSTASFPGAANSGNAIASMLAGTPLNANVREVDFIDRRSQYYGGFIQDDWKVSANLTLNLGIRWETHLPRTDANNRQNGFDLTAINPISGTPGVITFTGQNGYAAHTYDPDFNNWSPRFGFAWKPFQQERTVLRSGYGIFYGPPLPGSNNASAGYENSGDFQSPDNGVTAPFLLRNGVPNYARTELNAGFGAVRVGQAIRFAPEFHDRNRRLGYTQQFNMNVQQSLGFNTFLEASYIGTVGHKLNGPDVNINQVLPSQMAAGNAQIRRPFPQFGNVTLITPMWGNSSYHAMNLKLEKRFSAGLNFLSNYTWSKFIDDVTASQEAGAVGGGMQNYYDRKAEKALAGNDIRHRLTFSSVYELPWGRGRKWLSDGVAATMIGGWNLGSIMTLQAGSPVGLVTQANTTNAFSSGSQRVNLIRDPSLPAGERTVARWFDTTAVTAPPQFTFGNAGRAILTGPGLAVFNFSLLKNFAFTDRWNLQFRAEAFNAFNRANFQEPGRALGAAGFGVISVADAPRNLQLGLKLTF